MKRYIKADIVRSYKGYNIIHGPGFYYIIDEVALGEPMTADTIQEALETIDEIEEG